MKSQAKFILLVSLIIVCFAIGLSFADGIVYRTSNEIPPREVSDIYKKTSDFIEVNGYIAEIHSVTTEDNYIVTMHRVLGRQSEYASNEVKQLIRPVVLIQHGIAGRSDNWLLNGQKSFPFLLVNAGYDVWLADSRGNSYSKRHIFLSSNNRSFWDFSFHEQGCFDLAAMTDYVINTTGQKKIFYIGHSRGSTMALVLLSLRPEYNDKFHLVVNFSPVAYLKNAKSPILRAFFKGGSSEDFRTFQKLARNLRSITLPGINDKTVQLRKNFCNNGSPTQPLCSKLLFLLSGYDYDLLNSTMIPIYATHFPDGGSLKEYLHYIQIAQSDKFRQFDYGKSVNMKIYGQPEPPEYNLENITAPISINYGPNDFVVNIKDLERLSSRLRNIVASYQVPFEKFNHIDFLWGTKADVLIYEPTLKLLNSFL